MTRLDHADALRRLRTSLDWEIMALATKDRQAMLVMIAEWLQEQNGGLKAMRSVTDEGPER